MGKSFRLQLLQALGGCSHAVDTGGCIQRDRQDVLTTFPGRRVRVSAMTRLDNRSMQADRHLTAHPDSKVVLTAATPAGNQTRPPRSAPRDTMRIQLRSEMYCARRKCERPVASPPHTLHIVSNCWADERDIWRRQIWSVVCRLPLYICQYRLRPSRQLQHTVSSQCVSSLCFAIFAVYR